MNKLMLVIPALAMLVMSLGLVQAQYTVTVNVQVAPYLQVTTNYNAVDFGTLNLGPTGITDKPAPSQEQGIYNYTIKTNLDYEVNVCGKDFSSSFTINNLKFQATDSTANINVAKATTLSTSYQLVGIFPNSVSTLYHAYWLSVPANTPPGSYSTTVYIDIYNV